MKFFIGVDTGGTFTDCVLMDERGGIITSKAPSTPYDFSIGVMDSIKEAASSMDMAWEEVLSGCAIFSHGTTVATNAMLTRTGAKTGHITTKGFEDTLLIGRIRQKVAGLNESEIIDIARLDKADPIVPRPLIKGVTERIDWQGKVVVPLNKREAENMVKSLIEEGVEAISVCLLWSFMNPSHEQQIKDIIGKIAPQCFVTLSSELVPVIKEYERAATTTINAYLSRTISTYFSSLEDNLKKAGLRTSPIVMQAMGGVASIYEVRERAVNLISSGPVGGIMASLSLGEVLGYNDIITTDVGGTSFDVGLIVNGEPEYSEEPVIAKYHLLIPMINITSIGAGGGSIAWIEPDTKLLRVGPQSAGANPGPACYDLEGTEPTVTDADVALNRIDPNYFLGGKMKLNKDKAISTIQDRVANPLDMTPVEAAMGMVDIIDSKMADLVRKITIGKGYDPKDFVLFAFGGGGPTHVGSYAMDVGVKSVIIPSFASVFSALGIIRSDIVHIKELSYPMVFPLDLDKLNEIYESLEKAVRDDFTKDGLKEEDLVIFGFADMRYRGQTHQVRTPVSRKKLVASDLGEIMDEYERRYEQRYGSGTAYKAAGIEAINYQIRGIGKIELPPFKKFEIQGENPSGATKGKREVYFKECDGFYPTDIYDGLRLKAGNIVKGPSIIERPDTTVVIHPGQMVKVDEYLNLIMSVV